MEDLLRRMGEMVEREAVSRAGMAKPVIKKRQRSKSPTELRFEFPPYPALKDQDLTNDVARAAGPNYPAGTGLPDPNPDWPNAGQPWSLEFTPRVTAALVKVINLGLTRLSESVTANMTHYLATSDRQLTGHLRSFEAIQAEVARLSNLVKCGWMSFGGSSPGFRHR